MSFVKKAVRGLGGLLGRGIAAVFGGKRFAQQQQPALPRPATRDDAAREAEREQELARRRGQQFDRISGASGEPVGGLGRLIVGS